MRRFLFALLPTVAALGFVGCAGEERVTQNLANQLARQRRVAGVFDLSRDALSSLDVGVWYGPERIPDGSDWVWMHGESGQIPLTIQDPDANVMLLAVRPPASGPRRVRVTLEDRQLGEVTIERMAVLRLDLPPELVSVGVRTIGFEALGDEVPAGERSFALDYVALVPAADEPAKLVAENLRALAERPRRTWEGVALELVENESTEITFLTPDDGEVQLDLRGQPGARLHVRLAGAAETGEATGPVIEDVVELEVEARAASYSLADLEGSRTRLSLYVPPAGGSVQVASAGLTGRRKPTSVVFIVVDTLRADHIVSDDVDTPNLDRLAADGALFESAFAHAPTTLPSHTALLSSRYPHLTGVVGNGQRVTTDLPLFQEWLQLHGYDTRGVIGIGTLWTPIKGHGLDRGFDAFDDYTRHQPRADNVLSRLPKQLYGLSREDPFFLFVHFSDPHVPYNAHGSADRRATLHIDGSQMEEFGISEMVSWEDTLTLSPGTHSLVIESDDELQVRRLDVKDGSRWLEFETLAGGILTTGSMRRFEVRFEVTGEAEREISFSAWFHDRPAGLDDVKQRYALEVEYSDEAVGEVLRLLEEQGLYDSSLIVFTSDHGEELGEHGHVGHIEHLYDGMIQVPLIIKPPAGDDDLDAMRSLSSRVFRHIDVVPTVLYLMDLPDLPGQMGQPIHVGRPREHFSETHKPTAQNDIYSLRDDAYKLIYNATRKKFEMYDLKADPEEMVDIYDERNGERRAWVEILRDVSVGELPEMGAIVDPDLALRLRALGYN